MKNLRSLSFMWPWLTNYRTLPGVPITMWGASFPSRIAMSSLIGTPPKKTWDLICGICLVKRITSFLIWYASSLTLHRIRAVFGFGSSSICCKMEMINTAVLPIPDTAWHKTSLPWTDWGMHSYWTSDGCSKPQSWIALFNSLFKSISLKLEQFTPYRPVDNFYCGASFYWVSSTSISAIGAISSRPLGS